jgi:chromosome segregation protein
VASRHEGVGKGVQAVLQSRREGADRLVADALAAPPDLAPAVAAVLAERWQDVLVDGPERAVSVVEWLRGGNRGRASFVPDGPARGAPVPPHPPMPGILGMLFEKIGGEREVPGPLCEVLRPVVLADTLAAAIEAWRARREDGVEYSYVTLEGDVLDASGRITGGSPEKAGAGLLATHAEIRALEPRVEALENLTDDLTTQLEAARERLRETQRLLEETRADLHAQELTIVTVERDVKAHEAEALRARARLEQLAKEIAETEQALREMEREDAQFDATVSDATARREAAREGLMTDEAEAQAWRGEVERANAKVTDAKIAATRAAERATSVRNTVTRLERSAGELEAREQRLTAELTELAKRQELAAGQEGALRESLATRVVAAQRLRDELAACRMRYDTLKHDAGNTEALVRQARARKEALGRQLNALELRAREEALATEHLIASVAEKHHVVLPRVVGEYHLRPPPDDTHRARAEELRQLIERMGEVNLTAIEEYAEQEKRFTFFREQKADIEKALAQLEEAIAQMNRESRKRFEETFAAVNANFQQLFPRLFRGGKGALQLTDPDDLLETGVEIIAQPPGKKLVNLEAMSGGEKTLTAVTLLFALFMYRPSPFCLLDEVEAALDEANVIRLVDLVRDLTDRSQFIMITHNKRTMAMADVLYGVTMEEPGVSKLVSVKLRSAETKKGDDESATPAVA